MGKNFTQLSLCTLTDHARFTATVPTVIEELGYSAAHAQLLTIPIYLFAMIVVIVFAFWSDRVKQRSPFIMAGFAIAVVGLIAQLAIPHPKLPGLTYGFLFPVAAGFYSPFICIVAWIGMCNRLPLPDGLSLLLDHNGSLNLANNLAPSSKRAVGMAVLISFGNFGGIAGSNIYLASQAPRYPTGFGVGLGVSAAAIVMAFVLRRSYAAENRRRRALLDEQGEDVIRAKYTEQELLELGDRSPFYLYTL